MNMLNFLTIIVFALHSVPVLCETKGEEKHEESILISVPRSTEFQTELDRILKDAGSALRDRDIKSVPIPEGADKAKILEILSRNPEIKLLTPITSVADSGKKAKSIHIYLFQDSAENIEWAYKVSEWIEKEDPELSTEVITDLKALKALTSKEWENSLVLYLHLLLSSKFEGMYSAADFKECKDVSHGNCIWVALEKTPKAGNRPGDADQPIRHGLESGVGLHTKSPLKFAPTIWFWSKSGAYDAIFSDPDYTMTKSNQRVLEMIKTQFRRSRKIIEKEGLR